MEGKEYPPFITEIKVDIARYKGRLARTPKWRLIKRYNLKFTISHLEEALAMVKENFF